MSSVENDHQLIENWRSCDLANPPYLFPGDKEYLEKTYDYGSFDDYVRDYGTEDESIPRLGLLPMPYVGNLEKASIFILMLNPGFAPCDYYAEQHALEYRKALIRNLRQENGNDDYPFFFLDPQFAWHSGGEYWQRKFKNLLYVISENKKVSYQKAMKDFSKIVACLELFPYHSKSFGVEDLLNTLPSVLEMKKFVCNELVSKAGASSKLIIVARSVNKWNLPTQKNIIEYQGAAARGAHFSPGSDGGNAILEFLKINNSIKGMTAPSVHPGQS